MTAIATPTAAPRHFDRGLRMTAIAIGAIVVYTLVLWLALTTYIGLPADAALPVAIQQTVNALSIGAIYATLGRLNDKGFVSFSISDPDPVRGGRARKLVALTKLGQRALAHSVTSFTRMAEGLPLVPAPGARR